MLHLEKELSRQRGQHLQRASAGHLIWPRSRMEAVREERSAGIHLERQQDREEGASVQITQGLWATAGVAFHWVVALEK